MRNKSMVNIYSFLDAIAVLVLIWNYTGRFVSGLILAAIIFLVKSNVFQTTGKIKENLKELLIYLMLVAVVILTVGMLEDFKWYVKVPAMAYFLLQFIFLVKIKFGKK